MKIGLALILICFVQKLGALEQTTLTLRIEDNGKTVQVPLDSYIRIELIENLTTGFGWELHHLNKSFLASIGTEKQTLPAAPKEGSGMLSIWTFKPIRIGVTDVELLYYRPWEGIEHSVESFKVTLEIVSR